MGSGANLSAFSMLKEFMVLECGFADGAFVDMVCGLSSGVVSWFGVFI